MSNDELLSQCISEEQELQFEEVNQEEMLKLALTIEENNKAYPGPLAVLIKINEKTVFSYYPDGTGHFHEQWLQRKANTVHMMEISSLHFYANLQKSGESLEKDCLLDPENYAQCGGGFPIRLKNGCVVGSVCVSGLFHLLDHSACVEGIRKYLNSKKSEK